MNKLFMIALSFVVMFCIVSCTTKKGTEEAYCSKFKKTSDGKTVVRLQQQWFANSGFAGELVAQKSTADKFGLKLDVIPGSDQIDTRQVVKSGDAEFGVAGAEQVMLANEKGANLVIIGVINYKSLACFISKKKRGITKPKDFEGHKIGTMEGSPVDLIYNALKSKEKLQIDVKHEIPTGWAITGFVQDQYDVYPAFINDEPITLRMKGIEVDIIEPSNYDINFIGTVYFCKKELVENCPELVQNFVNAIADGWAVAIKDPKLAIDLLKDYDKNIDATKELESLKRGIEYYKGEDGRILYTTDTSWKNMAELLKSIGYIKVFDKNKTVDNKFISWYHSRVRTKTE